MRLLDCSRVRDEDLRQSILGVWRRPRRINVSFGQHLANHEHKVIEKDGLKVARKVSEVFQAHMRAALQQWQSAAEGLIHFVEKPFLVENDNGIVLSTCGSYAQFLKKDLLGITYYWLDGDHLSRAVACFPEGYIERGGFDSNRTALHEIGHTLGADHMHNIDRIRQALMATRGGKLCSVMPYASEIDSPVSSCHVDLCIPPFATRLGPLDRRWLQQAYGAGVQRYHQGGKFSVALARWSRLPPLGVALSTVILVMVVAHAMKQKLLRRSAASRGQNVTSPANVLAAGAIDVAAVAALAVSMGASKQLLQVALITVLLKSISLLCAARVRSPLLITRGLEKECISLPLLAALMLGQHHSYGSRGYKVGVCLLAFFVGLLGCLMVNRLGSREHSVEARAPILPL